MSGRASLVESLLDRSEQDEAAPIITGNQRALATLACAACSFLGSSDPLMAHYLQTLAGTTTDVRMPILFWKHVGMTVVGVVWAVVENQTSKPKPKSYHTAAMGFHLNRREMVRVAVAAFFLMLVNTCWTYSILMTTASHCVSLFIMSPPWACILGWALLGKRPENHTLFAAFLAFMAAAGIMAVSYLEPPPGDAAQESGAHVVDFSGDVVALMSGIFLACYTTTLDWGHSTCPTAPMHIAAPLAAVGVVLATLVGSWGIGYPLRDLLGEGVILPGFAIFALVNSFTEAVWDIVPSWAAKYISAPSIGLVLLLELPLGPLYVLLAFGEKPSAVDVVLGLVMLLALAIEHVVPALYPDMVDRARTHPVAQNARSSLAGP